MFYVKSYKIYIYLYIGCLHQNLEMARSVLLFRTIILNILFKDSIPIKTTPPNENRTVNFFVLENKENICVGFLVWKFYEKKFNI